MNGHCASDQDVALHFALAEGFFVVAALGVAVVELTDRGVAPVHDGNSRARIREGGATDEHVALYLAPVTHAFAQAQVPEIRRARIYQHGLQVGAGERNLLQTFHLGDERGHVFQARLADLVAQGHQLGIVGTRAPRRLVAAGRFLRRRRGQALHHPRKEALFLSRNVIGRAVRVVVHVQSEL